MEIVKQYIYLGFTHVVPLGLDHILFILSIFLVSKNWSSLIVQCSVFTLAHSISLGLSAAGIIISNPKFIEPLIALTILFTSIDNIVNDKERKWRLALIFIFGLIHGMGFANALRDIGIPENHFVLSVLFFNVGVEIGQLTVVLLAYYLISYWFSKKDWYRKRIVYPASSMIACVALYWTIERVLLN